MALSDTSPKVKKSLFRKENLLRLAKALLGDQPEFLALFFLPTLAGVLIDFLLRFESIYNFAFREKASYLGSALIGAGIWGPITWALIRLWHPSWLKAQNLTRPLATILSLAVVAPLAFFAFGGQVIYYRVFHSYIARDSIRLGIELRGTVGAWMAAWGFKLVPAALGMLLMLSFVVLTGRKTSLPIRKTWPLLPFLAFAASLGCLFADFLDTRGLQTSPPDVCLLHGVVGLVHERLTSHGPPKGMSIRQPLPLPPLDRPAYRPNVILVITESVRADAVCSDPASGCKSQFLDEAAKDRLALGKTTSQSSGTFSSCLTLWTGLAPNADFQTAHHAPVLWELAKAIGYRTAYLGAQNLRYRDLGAFLRVANIDVLISAAELGHTNDTHLGAPDELATEKAVEFAKASPDPYFAVVHLSNTHWPYRVDPDLQPFSPHDADPFQPVGMLHNHYNNSVLLQERTLAKYIAELKALPSWNDTVLLFVSDHGEQFREHGGLYHLNNLFEEEIRIPGFIIGGANALRPQHQLALALWRLKRVFSEDVHATVLDALGLFDSRSTFPLAEHITGRSLLRPFESEAAVMASTTSGVWMDNDPVYGILFKDKKVVGGDESPWVCYDLNRDLGETSAYPAKDCDYLVKLARQRFPNVPSVE